MRENRLKLGNTGYCAGDIYVKELADFILKQELYIPTDEEIKYGKRKKFLYDKSTGNIHMFLKDTIKSEKIAKETEEKLRVIKNKLGQKTKFILASGSTKWTGDMYYNSKDLFCYVKVDREDISYQITGIRFKKNKEKKTVDCILKSLQFIVYNTIEEPKSIDFYPVSNENDFKGELAEDGVSYYYNPESSFYDPAETIANEFINFIKKNEEKQKCK